VIRRKPQDESSARRAVVNVFRRAGWHVAVEPETSAPFNRATARSGQDS
jgi:hypothetical protein